jgi:DNA integrity scanning protein DisA with diadenylate cyclase activity
MSAVVVTDVFDVVLVAVLLFAVLSWLRRSVPRTVARRSLGLAAVGGVGYLAATQLGLVVLPRLLEASILILVVGLVVVYQTDIRRVVDHTFSQRHNENLAPRLFQVLGEAVPELAARKLGALIALRGREPWPSSLSGGVSLNGAISVPLLLSLFDHSTPGHDGAVLVEGQDVTRFAVHFPLATDLPDVSKYGGTRHAAALGLARECDALLIVVSEERGTTSLAEQGALVAVDDPAALQRRLLAYAARVGAHPSAPVAARQWLGLRLHTAGAQR